MRKPLLFVAALSAALLALPAAGQKKASSLDESEKTGIIGVDSVVRTSKGGNYAELSLPVAYRDSNVVFKKVNDGLYIGSGHLMASETMYLVIGNKKALLIDTGTHIPELKEVVAKLTGKPYDVVLTHVHPDHGGSIDAFGEVWMNEADTTNLRLLFPNHKCGIRYLRNGQKFELGGRTIEVLFTPGHTPGSTTFIDQAGGYGFSGDSFGNGNLLLGGTFSGLIATCQNTLDYMVDNHIRFFFNGHYYGGNPETPQRLENLVRLSRDILSGKVEGRKVKAGLMGLDHVAEGDGFHLNYGEAQMR
jgi:glyoxylase-like metal-dependent hydrolase (beta-lactamase superfamily II)